MKLTEREQRIIKLSDALVRDGLSKLQGDALGWCFVWGVVEIPRLSGPVAVKHCFGSHCLADHAEAYKVGAKVPGVRITHINLD